MSLLLIAILLSLGVLAALGIRCLAAEVPEPKSDEDWRAELW